MSDHCHASTLRNVAAIGYHELLARADEEAETQGNDRVPMVLPHGWRETGDASVGDDGAEVNGIVLEKDGARVLLVNESEAAHCFDWDWTVASLDREAVARFLADFGITVEVKVAAIVKSWW